MLPGSGGVDTHLGELTQAWAPSKKVSQPRALAAGLLHSPDQVEETPGALAIPKEATVFSCPRAFMLQLHHCPAKHPQKHSSIPSTKASPGMGLFCNMTVHRLLGIPSHRTW